MLVTERKYHVVDMVEKTQGNPLLFTPPPPNAVKKLWVGANVLIAFETDPSDDPTQELVGEALWVTITNLADKEGIVGVVNLDSQVIPGLKARTLVKFTANSILDIDFWDAV